MIDGSNDSAVFTPDEWDSWLNSRSGLDNTKSSDPLGNHSTFDATGLAGGGSNMTLTDFSNGIAPEDLSIRTGVSLGTSAQLSPLSGSQGNEL